MLLSSLTAAAGLTTFTTPYFINKENLNWGAKYAYIWAGSNMITFCRPAIPAPIRWF